MTFDILTFCQKRGLSSEGIRLSQSVDWNTRHTDDSKIEFVVKVPPEFPEKYHKALRAAAKSCLVGKLARGVNEDTIDVKIGVAG